MSLVINREISKENPAKSADLFPSVKHPEIFNLNGGRCAWWSDGVYTWCTNLSICGGAFKCIRKKPWNYVMLSFNLINKSCVGEVLSNTKKEETWSAFMITWCSTPTYASIIHLYIIHSKPTMSQLAMNHKLSYQSSNLSCKPSYFSLCNQLCKWVCIISK